MEAGAADGNSDERNQGTVGPNPISMQMKYGNGGRRKERGNIAFMPFPFLFFM